MARHKGDHDARRRDVSRAVWAVLADRGFDGLTLRAVAAEMGATTGLLTHYFPTKKDLVAHALALLEEHSGARPRRSAPEGLASLRAALLDILPLTPESAARSRIWVSSWDAALADADFSAEHAARYARSRERIGEHVRVAQRLGELSATDPDDTTAAVQSFALGLVVQALFGAPEFPPERQTRLLDDYLASLVTQESATG